MVGKGAAQHAIFLRHQDDWGLNGRLATKDLAVFDDKIHMVEVCADMPRKNQVARDVTIIASMVIGDRPNSVENNV